MTASLRTLLWLWPGRVTTIPMPLSRETTRLNKSLVQRRGATWQDYVAIRDSAEVEWRKISFYKDGYLSTWGQKGRIMLH